MVCLPKVNQCHESQKSVFQQALASDTELGNNTRYAICHYMIIYQQNNTKFHHKNKQTENETSPGLIFHTIKA